MIDLSVALDVAAILVTVLFLVLPGVVVLRAMKWQGWAYCAAPVVTYGCVVIAMNIDNLTGIGWTPLTLLLGTAVLATAAWGTTRWHLPSWGLPKQDTTLGHASTPQATGWSATGTADLTLWAAMLIGGCFGTAVISYAMAGYANVHQDWDAAFHGSTTRLISDLATTDLDALGEVLRPQDPQSFFYPAAWHALTALGEWVPGMSVPRLMNASIALIPFSAVFALGGLVRTWSGSAPLAIVTALILPWSASFPYDMLWRGPLLPYTYGMAFLPAVCLLALKMYATRTLAGAVVLGTGAAAMVVLHPSMAIMATIFLLAFTTQRWVITRGKSIVSDLTSLTVAALIAIPGCLTVLIGAMSVTNTAEDVDWPAYKNTKEALFAVLTDSNWDRAPNYAAPIVGLIALVVGWRYLHRWIGWAIIGAFFAWLYVLAAAIDSEFVQTMTGFWWNDAYRLISVTWLVAPVIVACGVVAAATLVGGAVARGVSALQKQQPAMTARSQRNVNTATGAVIVAAMFFATGFGSSQDTVALMTHKWEGGMYVDDEEQRAYAELPAQLGPNAYVLNDPNDGSPWLYTMEGVDQVFLSRLSEVQRPFLSENEKLMIDKFRDIDTDPAVQQAVKEMGITHLVLGTPSEEMVGRPPGLQNIPQTKWLTPMPNVGPMRVWKVTPPAE